MHADSIKIEQILKYILSIASGAEGFDRELNRIQLIKYLYLVDLDYAYHNNGETYSGIDWEFYHYGPWNLELFKKIDPILLSAGAIKKTESTIFEKDSIKYYFDREPVWEDESPQIDLRVQGSIQHYVRVFGNDTSRLLSFVYNTKPMLNAAPNQRLDFKTCIREKAFAQSEKEKLTARQKKKLKQKAKEFKQKLKQKIELKKKQKALLKPPEPRYDEVYLNGIAAIEEDIDSSELDSLSGFSSVNNDVWNSGMRKASDNE